MENANGHADEKVSDLDGAAPDSTDSALYFCTYAFLFHQVLHLFQYLPNPQDIRGV